MAEAGNVDDTATTSGGLNNTSSFGELAAEFNKINREMRKLQLDFDKDTLVEKAVKGRAQQGA